MKQLSHNAETPEKRQVKALVKQQLAGIRRRYSLFDFGKSKKDVEYAHVITAAFQAYVQGPEIPSAGVVYAFTDLLKSCRVSPDELASLSNDLLLIVKSLQSTHLRIAVISILPSHALNFGLSNAIKVRDQVLAKELLANGATSQLLTDTEYVALVSFDAAWFRELQSKQRLNQDRLQLLCERAIAIGDPYVLGVLLPYLDTEGQMHGPRTAHPRNNLLITAIECKQYDILRDIVSITWQKPLEDASVLEKAFTMTRCDPVLQSSAMELLLWLVQDARRVAPLQTLESLYLRSIQSEAHDMVELFVRHELMVSESVVEFACRRGNVKSLKCLLQGDVTVPSRIWSAIEGTNSRDSRALMRKQLILYLKNRDMPIPHKEEALLYCIDQQQVDLVELLIDAGASADFENGEPLQRAVLSRNSTTVGLLATSGATMHTVDRAALTTVHLDMASRSRIIKVLLTGNVSSRVLECLICVLLCATQMFDKELLEVLLEARDRISTLRSDSTPSRIDKELIDNCLESQNIIRSKISRNTVEHRRHEATVDESCLNQTGSLLNPSVYRPASNTDEALQDLVLEAYAVSDDVLLHLLNSHIHECLENIGAQDQWHQGTVKLILRFTKSTFWPGPKFLKCLSMLADAGQVGILQCFLEHGTLPKAFFDNLRPELIDSDQNFRDALLGHLTSRFLNDIEYTEVLERLLLCACHAQKWFTAISICSKARCKLRIDPAANALKIALHTDHNVPVLHAMLKRTVAEQATLDLLWRDIFVCECGNIHQKAHMLLDVGFTGQQICETLQNVAAARGDDKLGALILEHWRPSLQSQPRPRYDFETRSQVVSQLLPVVDVQMKLSALGAAYKLAVKNQHWLIFCLLNAEDAPSVSNECSILAEAVVSGPKQSSLEQDRILDRILEQCLLSTNAEQALNFALLEAVKCDRSKLAFDLVRKGASALAYSQECWELAVHRGDKHILRSLVSTEAAREDLAANFTKIFRHFGDDDMLEHWFVVFSRLVAAGFRQRKCFSWALLTLCCRYKLVNAERAAKLIDFGASVEYEDGKCLEQLWVHGDLLTFKVLIEKCNDKAVVASLLIKACQKINEAWIFFPSSESHKTSEVFYLLLQYKLPRSVLDAALNSLRMGPRCNRLDMMEAAMALLRAGAHYTEVDESPALYDCLLINDSQLNELIQISKPSSRANTCILARLLQDLDLEEELDRNKRENIIILLRRVTRLGLRISYASFIAFVVTMLGREGTVPMDLMHNFFTLYRLEPLTKPDLSFCTNQLERAFRAALIACSHEFKSKSARQLYLKRLHLVLQWTHLSKVRWVGDVLPPKFLAWSDKFVHEMLRLASSLDVVSVVETLLLAGADPNCSSKNAPSPLFCAAQAGSLKAVQKLIDFGANANDGSLHVAVSKSRVLIIKSILIARPDLLLMAREPYDAPALIVFARHQHSKKEIEDFQAVVRLVMIAMCEDDAEKDAAEGVFVEALRVALKREQYASSIASALLGWVEVNPAFCQRLRLAKISEGGFVYSPLSFVEKVDNNHLRARERALLVQDLEALGVKRAFYAESGDQPEDAVGVPLEIINAEEARRRRKAFESKLCCVCGDTPDYIEDIHAGLMPACTKIHGWDDEIICTDDLQQHLKSRMFPDDKTTFPSTKVTCWAPKCQGTVLSHNVIQEHADAETFNTYDTALCQQALREGTSMGKCAKPGCPGAVWFDAADAGVTLFFCPVCFENTCVECNDLYDKHNNKPCPAGEKVQKNARIKAEEALSKAALDKEKKCPKCKLKYQKISGCDHIRCGRNAYGTAIDRGCRFEFCHVCLSPKGWPNHKTSCTYTKLMR